jgi:predicted dehydrogenase
MVRVLDCQGTHADFKTHSFHTFEEDHRRGFLQEDASFIDCILNGTEPKVTAYDGYKAVELVESVYKAIRTGERVKFE